MLGAVRRAANEFLDDEEVILNKRECERRLLLRGLEKADGNRTTAATLLGISRSTLFNMMKRHGIADRRSRRRQL